MGIEAYRWVMTEPKAPMERRSFQAAPAAGEVVVQVAGCGVCHTDLGFFYDGVPTRHPFPLTLGHEISGHVVDGGRGRRGLAGPGGRRAGRPAVRRVRPVPSAAAARSARQKFPGQRRARRLRHARAGAGRGPLRGADEQRLAAAGVDLAALSVIADAVSTPYQAIAARGLAPGDLAVFVGAGGVGGFGVQIAAALGAMRGGDRRR